MTKHVQLQDLETKEVIYPLTEIGAVDGLESRLRSIEKREDKDTVFDPSDIEDRLEKLESSSYDDTEIRESLGEKCNVVVCDNQYEFDQILTKDNNTIYLIKGDQDTWASREDVEELYKLVKSLQDKIEPNYTIEDDEEE